MLVSVYERKCRPLTSWYVEKITRVREWEKNNRKKLTAIIIKKRRRRRLRTRHSIKWMKVSYWEWRRRLRRRRKKQWRWMRWRRKRRSRQRRMRQRRRQRRGVGRCDGGIRINEDGWYNEGSGGVTREGDWDVGNWDGDRVVGDGGDGRGGGGVLAALVEVEIEEVAEMETKLQ